MLARSLSLAIALSWCAASVARADCPIELRGLRDLVRSIAPAVAAFGDDRGSCVSVRALCTRQADVIVLDLEDTLGGRARRWFTSPEGAAAFLISWSRRPLPQDGTGLELLATPGAARASDGRVRGELRIAFTGEPFVHSWWGAVEGAAVRERGLVRYGAAMRLMSSSVTVRHFDAAEHTEVLLGFDVEGTAGPVVRGDRWMVRGEIAAGLGIITATSQEGSLTFQAAGPRGGLRASFAYELVPTLWLDVSGGWDLLYEAFSGHDSPDHVLEGGPTFDQAHAEIGLLWAP